MSCYLYKKIQVQVQLTKRCELEFQSLENHVSKFPKKKKKHVKQK